MGREIDLGRRKVELAARWREGKMGSKEERQPSHIKEHRLKTWANVTYKN